MSGIMSEMMFCPFYVSGMSVRHTLMSYWTVQVSEMMKMAKFTVAAFLGQGGCIGHQEDVIRTDSFFRCNVGCLRIYFGLWMRKMDS